MSRSLKAHLLLILTTLVWGASFVVIKNALRDITPLLFNAIRMSVAAVTLLLVFWKDLRGMGRKVVGSGVLIGICLWAGNELQTSGLKYTAASKSAFLTGLAVVLVPAFLGLFWRRPIGRWSACGVVLALAGLYLLTIPATANGSPLAAVNRGDLMTIAAAVIFTFHIIFMGHAAQWHSWRQITVLQSVTAGVLNWIAVPVLERPTVAWSAPVVVGILLTGFFSLAAAFSVQAWAQQFIPATHTALIFSLEPVFASLTSFLVLGERLGVRGLFGAGMILAGVLLSEEGGASESMGVAPDHAAVPVSGGK